MNSFQWINDLAQWAGRLFPRLTLVPPTHRGVMFGPRGGAKEVGVGLVAWWPLLQKLVQVDIRTESIDVAAIAMPTGHEGIAEEILGDHTLKYDTSGFNIPRVETLAAVVQWQVINARDAALGMVDMKRMIDNTCQAEISEAGNVEGAREAIAEIMAEYGVDILTLKQTSSGQAAALIQMAGFTNTSNG